MLRRIVNEATHGFLLYLIGFVIDKTTYSRLIGG